MVVLLLEAAVREYVVTIVVDVSCTINNRVVSKLLVDKAVSSGAVATVVVVVVVVVVVIATAVVVNGVDGVSDISVVSISVVSLGRLLFVSSDVVVDGSVLVVIAMVTDDNSGDRFSMKRSNNVRV